MQTFLHLTMHMQKKGREKKKTLIPLKRFGILCTAFCLCMTVMAGAAAVAHLFTFEDEMVGADVKATALDNEFYFNYGTPASKATVVGDSSDGGKRLQLEGYVDIKSYSNFVIPYTFSADIISSVTDNYGIFVKGVDQEEQVQKENTKNQNVVQIFNYYEWDWYAENGGTSGGSGIGGSGIFIIPSTDKIKIGVKTYQADGLTVASAAVEFPVPEGYRHGESVCSVKVADHIENVEIFVNETLLCKIELSEPGQSYESDQTGIGFYKTAVIRNAAGDVLKTVENTRVCSDYSQLAITSRNQKYTVDNIRLQYEAPDPTPTAEPTATPEPTKPPKTADRQTSAPMASETGSSDTDHDRDDGGLSAAVIAAILITAGIVVLGCAAAIFIAKNRRK